MCVEAKDVEQKISVLEELYRPTLVNENDPVIILVLTKSDLKEEESENFFYVNVEKFCREKKILYIEVNIFVLNNSFLRSVILRNLY